MEHISIFNKKIYSKDYIKLILEGKKRMDAKFSDKKYPPFDKLKVDDIVYLKESGGPILGHAIISKVSSFEVKNCKHVRDILEKNKNHFAIDSESELNNIYLGRKDKKYCTLFTFKKCIKYEKPIKYSSKGRSSWVIKIK